jgi:DNA-binding phage protein
MTKNQNQNEQWMLLVLLLKQIAEQKELTQEIIAEKADMHQSHISRFFALKYAPNMDTFVNVSKAIGVNFFFEDQESRTDLNLAMEKAMEQLGRRVNKLPKN